MLPYSPIITKEYPVVKDFFENLSLYDSAMLLRLKASGHTGFAGGGNCGTLPILEAV